MNYDPSEEYLNAEEQRERLADRLGVDENGDINDPDEYDESDDYRDR